MIQKAHNSSIIPFRDKHRIIRNVTSATANPIVQLSHQPHLQQQQRYYQWMIDLYARRERERESIGRCKRKSNEYTGRNHLLHDQHNQ